MKVVKNFDDLGNAAFYYLRNQFFRPEIPDFLKKSSSFRDANFPPDNDKMLHCIFF